MAERAEWGGLRPPAMPLARFVRSFHRSPLSSGPPRCLRADHGAADAADALGSGERGRCLRGSEQEPPRRRFVPHLADRAWPRPVYAFASSGSEARVFTETGPWPNMPFQADEAPKAGPSGRPPWTSPLNAGVGRAEKIDQRTGRRETIATVVATCEVAAPCGFGGARCKLRLRYGGLLGLRGST